VQVNYTGEHHNTVIVTPGISLRLTVLTVNEISHLVNDTMVPNEDLAFFRCLFQTRNHRFTVRNCHLKTQLGCLLSLFGILGFFSLIYELIFVSLEGVEYCLADRVHLRGGPRVVKELSTHKHLIGILNGIRSAIIDHR